MRNCSGPATLLIYSRKGQSSAEWHRALAGAPNPKCQPSAELRRGSSGAPNRKGQSSAEWLLAVVFLLFCISALASYVSQTAKLAAFSAATLANSEFLSKSSLIAHAAIISGSSATIVSGGFQAYGNCLSVQGEGACQMMPSKMHSDRGVIKYGGAQDETI